MSLLHSVERLTADEFLALPPAEERLELVGGEIIVTPYPSSDHQRVCLYIGHLILERIRTTGVLLHDKEMIVRTQAGGATVRAPDLLYIRPSRRDVVTQRAVEGPADIVIEVLSESSEETDRITRRDEYWACGVPEYWIVDLSNRAVLVHDFRAGTQALYRGHHAFRSPVLEELGLPGDFEVSEFFAVFD